MSKDQTPREKAIKLLEDRWIIKAMNIEEHKIKLAARNAHGTRANMLKARSFHLRTNKD